MDGVDIIDKKTAAYRLERKNLYRFYLRMFVDLIDVTHVKSHIVYMKIADDILLLNFKVVAAKNRDSIRKRSFPNSRPSKQKSHEPLMPREV